jgi:hypothetical protein
MARVKERELFWDPPADTDISHYAVYSGAPDVPDFLANVDAGIVEPLAEPAEPVLRLTEGMLEEGNYQFAVCSVDGAGNFSDPYQHPAWQSVPLDLTAPNPPSGGGLRTV